MLKLHESLQQVQFHLFEKLSAIKFQIEREKLYDYNHEKNWEEEVPGNLY